MSAISEKVSDIPNSDNQNPKVVEPTGVNHEISRIQIDQDTHLCAKCKLVFTSLDSYIQHKLSKDNCHVAFTTNQQALIPHLIYKNASKHSRVDDASSGPAVEQTFVLATDSEKGVDERTPDQYRCAHCDMCLSEPEALNKHVQKEHMTGLEEKVTEGDQVQVCEQVDVAQDDQIVQFESEIKVDRVDVTADQEVTIAEPFVSSDLSGMVVVETTQPDQDAGVVQVHIKEQLSDEQLSEVSLPARHEIHVIDPDKGTMQVVNLRELLSQKLEVLTDIPPSVVQKLTSLCSQRQQKAATHMIQPVREQRKDPSDEEDGSYYCQDCGRKFRDHNILKVHMLTHSDERNFPCTMKNCFYAFKTKGSLKRHMRRHTGERPFKCDLCGRCFGESGSLTRHLKARTSCTVKLDSQLPRYGKKVDFSQNIPAAVGSLATSSVQKTNPDDNLDDAVHVHVIVPDPGHQIMEEQATSSQADAVMSDTDQDHLSIDIVDNSEDVADDQEQKVSAETVEVETSGLDGLAGQEEVVEDAPKETVTQSLDFFCRVCKLVLPSETHLQQHLKTHMANAPYMCSMCSYAAHKKEDLNVHLVVTHHVKQEGNVEAKTELDMDTQNAQPSLSLEKVTESEKHGRDASEALVQLLEIDSSTKVAFHAAGAHGVCIRHRCPVCSRSFQGSSYLKLHMRTHTGEKPHRCFLCEKTFTSKDLLNKHLVVHSDERNYKCGECGKLFKRISHVREHLRVHSQDRPYPCSVCDKSFKTANACKVHIRTHNDSLPHECAFCKKRFREKSSLDRHVRTHTGEKPFSCKHCGRAFAEHTTLTRHLKAKVPCAQHSLLVRPQPSFIVQGDPVIVNQQQVPIVLAQTDQQQIPTVLAQTDQQQIPTVLAQTDQHQIPAVLAQTEQHQIPAVLAQTEQQLATVVAQNPQQQEEATVLAEFSSVVANTQQYMAPTAPDQTTQAGAGELIMVTDNIDVSMQEIVAEEVSMETAGEFFVVNQVDGQEMTVVSQTVDEQPLPSTQQNP